MNAKTMFLSLTAALALVACSPAETPPAASEAHEPPQTAAASQELDVEQLKHQLDAGENIFLLDVRTPPELAEHGSIAGSVNIPIDELEARLSEVPKDRPLVVYCMRGGRASRASELLEKNGYTGIEYGGITAWKEKGYPVVFPEGGAKVEPKE
jgi:rhodanese-related sulfurtransferase